MVFSSSIFIYLFLPLVLGIYFFLPSKARNIFLLAASLLFYAWGEQQYTLVMLISIVFNYIFGWLVGFWEEPSKRKVVVIVAVIFNLGLLGLFKYTNFLVNSLNVLFAAVGLQPISLAPIHLPIGISFFTFQAFSYVIDVYRREVQVQKRLVHLALYISFFPQLIAGPIVRYHDIATQLSQRVITREGFALGIRRFIIGLGKKVLIANTVATTADAIFAIPSDQLTPGLAWLGVICYTLQIYFDFSGYSDMAIGLGHMFGFTFLENFNYPYISQSIQEFWRRWHISLSTWFRDYLYIPLGGSRRSPARNYFNLVTVFLLCGLWHGASWNFMVWGLYHGLFLIIERMGFNSRLSTAWKPLRHLYALSVIMVGWVFFRAETLPQAFAMLAVMAGFARGSGLEYNVALYWNTELVLALMAGGLGSMPFLSSLANWWTHSSPSSSKEFLGGWTGLTQFAATAGLMLIFLLCSMQLAAGTHNPFIYFRF